MIDGLIWKQDTKMRMAILFFRCQRQLTKERNREYILPSLEFSKMLWGDRRETCHIKRSPGLGLTYFNYKKHTVLYCSQCLTLIIVLRSSTLEETDTQPNLVRERTPTVSELASFKAQFHWASLLATHLRIYLLLLNSLCVITLSCKVAARSASANEVEGWATFVATRWRF